MEHSHQELRGEERPIQLQNVLPIYNKRNRRIVGGGTD